MTIQPSSPGSSGTAVDRDPDYDFVPPLPKPGEATWVRKGTQCGECGMKFEYGKAYGFCCSNARCPTGWGGVS